MLREIVLSVGLIVLGADVAWSACPGQTGKAIFSDDFSDDSGGWDVDAHEAYVPGALQIKADSKSLGTGSLNSTFKAVEGDYCVVIAFPSTPPAPNDNDFLSIMFLGSDYKNRFQLTIYGNGEATIYHLDNNNWLTLMPRAKMPSIKTAPGAENTLRVVVKDEKLTFFINDTRTKVLRAQMPQDGNKFGFYAGVSSGANPANERVYSVKSYSVTEAP